LRATPADFRDSLEKAINGKLKCPLGGEFILQNKPLSTSRWTSTAWNGSSLQKVNDVPPEYRFPFLSWLKNVDLDFNLNASSLSSEIILDVATKNRTGSQTVDRTNDRKATVRGTPSIQKPTGPTDFGLVTIVSHHVGPITNVVYAPGGEQAFVVGFDIGSPSNENDEQVRRTSSPSECETDKMSVVQNFGEPRLQWTAPYLSSWDSSLLSRNCLRRYRFFRG